MSAPSRPFGKRRGDLKVPFRVGPYRLTMLKASGDEDAFEEQESRDMGAYVDVFKRKEVKYRMDAAQAAAFRKAIDGRMEHDRYGVSDVKSLYFDTLNHSVIARSMEKPLYKEKLRLRAYGDPADADRVFLELKKKFKGIVYKRRIGMTYAAAKAFMAGMPYAEAVGLLPLDPAASDHEELTRKNRQIAREIEAFIARNEPMYGAMLIECHREAFAEAADAPDPGDPIDHELRITFDYDIAYSEYAPLNASGKLVRGGRRIVDSARAAGPTRLLPKGEAIVEIKVLGSYPLWLVQVLDECGAKPSSFSKYGAAYTRCVEEARKNATAKEAM